MIIKSFELKKIANFEYKLFLLYGQNEGLKNEVIDNLKKKFKGTVENYDENQIINENEIFYEKIFNQSLFEKEKVITINRCSEKIFDIIKNTIDNEISDIKIILNANILEKKSVRVTRLARGLPMGGDLEFVDEATIMRAIEDRTEI